MKVVADLDLCQAHQMCQFEAPTVFGLTDDEEKVVVLDPNPSEDLRAEVTAAIKYCPAMALSLEDE